MRQPVQYYFEQWGYPCIGIVSGTGNRQFFAFTMGLNGYAWYASADGKRCFDGDHDMSRDLVKEIRVKDADDAANAEDEAKWQ